MLRSMTRGVFEVVRGLASIQNYLSALRDSAIVLFSVGKLQWFTSGGCLGGSWTSLGGSWGCFGASCEHLGEVVGPS